MNKVVSVAILALLGVTSAVKVRFNEDLYDDDEDTRETLKSIATAEKAHNYKFNGISKEEEKVLINSKSQLHFDDSEDFVANHPRKTSMFAGLNADMRYPEARPIGEILMQFEDSVLTQNNDEDEYNQTLESIAQVETQMGSNMKVPSADEKNYQIHGNKYENILADNGRVYMEEIDEA